jgi:hypothetical protein
MFTNSNLLKESVKLKLNSDIFCNKFRLNWKYSFEKFQFLFDRYPEMLISTSAISRRRRCKCGSGSCRRIPLHSTDRFCSDLRRIQITIRPFSRSSEMSLFKQRRLWKILSGKEMLFTFQYNKHSKQ